ncbi:hypothetical protein [Streptomyces griseus]|uniref:hypothetical protein n=1 Tax=Streptomyces griseus TaxID=1911 RepID=UPI0004C8B320|nr:hypothetical protein [Streptomyces griseus]
MPETVRVNRQIFLARTDFALGVSDLDEPNVRAEDLMERPAARRSWAATRDFRSQGTQGPESREFVETLGHAHVTISAQTSEKAPADA